MRAEFDAVQVAGRLVGQQNLRLVGQRAGNRHPLPLARGEFIGILPQAVLQAHLAQQSLRPFGAIVRRGAQGQHRNLNIFQDAQRGQQMKCLEDEADASASDRCPDQSPSRAVRS